jgi:acyl-CoA thioesterase
MKNFDNNEVNYMKDETIFINHTNYESEKNGIQNQNDNNDENDDSDDEELPKDIIEKFLRNSKIKINKIFKNVNNIIIKHIFYLYLYLSFF